MEEAGKITLDLPSVDEERLHGVCELHVHATPSIFERPYDEIELARQMRVAGYSAVLFKCHHSMSAPHSYLVRKAVPGIEVFGGVVLNYPVGGINPEAVEAAIGFGAKEVWMPTIHAANHIKIIGVAGYPQQVQAVKVKRRLKEVKGICILGPDGELVPELHEILEMIADAGIILGTCHLSLEEDFALIEAARKAGVKKILGTHPGWTATNWSIEDQVKMAEMGAMMEYCYNACMPYEARLDPKKIAEGVRRIGASRCVMATDLGQPYNPNPVDGMRQFIRLMMKLGLSEREIRAMTRDNPSRLLDI